MSAVEQGSEAWHQQRLGKVTGSRVGAILGHNPYQSREDVLREMVRDYFGAHREFVGNEATEHGHRMEPRARGFYEALEGVRVDETDMVQHPEFDWIGISPDGLVGIEGGLEIKCPYWAKRPYTMAQKPYYYDQVQLFIWTCGLEWCDFLCFFDPQKYHLERVEPNEKWWSESLPVMKNFIDEFNATVRSKRKSAKYLRDDTSNAEMIQDSRLARLQQLLLEANVLEERLSPLQKEIKELRTAVGSEFGTCTDGTVIVKAVKKSGAVDWQGIANKALSIPDVQRVIGEIDSWRKDGTTAYSVALLKTGDEE